MKLLRLFFIGALLLLAVGYMREILALAPEIAANPPSIKRIARRQVPCDAHNASPCASKAEKSATLLSERAAMQRESP